MKESTKSAKKDRLIRSLERKSETEIEIEK